MISNICSLEIRMSAITAISIKLCFKYHIHVNTNYKFLFRLLFPFEAQKEQGMCTQNLSRETTGALK